MKKLSVIFAGLMFIALTGCNTVAGAGKDVEKAGQATQDAAKNTSKEISKKQ